ncbi:hypothetical protein C5167_014184 [Papaver somniferum]|uniref:NAB domain-containing protein n=1 Tax=Papaver somniferum TaxID=3469 RepID=A0A4Y7J6F6_PAPSO|nr:hypothetical protein C5167_014184 [Papaver somniferum]
MDMALMDDALSETYQGAIVMSSKTMRRLESKKSLSWWFGDPKTNNNWETSLMLELQNQIARLRLELEKNKSYKGLTSDALDLISHVSDLASTVKQGLEEEGRIRSEKHRLSEQEVAKLKLELDGTKSSLNALEAQTAVLEEQNKTLDVYVSERDTEIKELKVAISDAKLKFRNEKSQLQKVILALEEGQGELETKLKNSESKVRKLVEEYKRAEVEHNEFRVLQRNREAEMHIEMERHLKAKIVEKGKEVQELNKNLHELGVDLGTLRAERDELDAKVISLGTDVVSRDEMICHMEEHLRRLHNEHVDTISRCEGATKQAEEQRKRLRRMEREVEWQRDMIAEGAEEKREAIRQLCFSLEHYRNRYYEFRNAFIELTKQAPVQDIAYYYRK